MGITGSVASTTPFSVRPSRLYDSVTRSLGSIWFLLLAVIVAKDLSNGYLTSPWTQLLSRSLVCVFYVALGILILTRPQAESQATGLLPRMMAFIGTYLPWSVTFLGHSDGAVLNMLSIACVIGGMVLAIITVSNLGRSFSVVPQARSVVSTGPYRWVRHPLYLTEEIAFLGVVLQALSPLSVAVFLAHIAVQMCRIHYEEALLHQTLSEYAAYERASPWRLIPFVW